MMLMATQQPARSDVLYCGDTTLETAAAYLAGLMAHASIRFQYVPSDRAIDEQIVAGPWSLVILSDYPAAKFSRELQSQVAARVEKGAGLLMLGGWESFHGLGGDWDGTPLGDLLPFTISKTDDRWNCDRLLLVKQRAGHPIV